MPVPHILAGTSGGTTAQLDANWAYFADAMVVASGNVGLGAAPANKLDVFHTTNGIGIRLRNTSTAVELALRTDATSSGLDAGNADAMTFSFNTVERARFDSAGNFIPSALASPPTLSRNNTLVMNLTSNTNLRISARGSDGVTRVANITLA